MEQPATEDDDVATLTAALAQDPTSGDLFYARARALHRLNRNEEAVDDYQQAITLLGEAAPASAHNDLGVTWKHLGQPERAIQCYTAALAMDPDLPLALINRGSLQGPPCSTESRARAAPGASR